MSHSADDPASRAGIYRPNVAAILEDAESRVLICERADRAGCWQFPQGGIKRGELPEAALPRELREELGLEPADYHVEERRGPYRYLFPAGQTKKGFRGQEQFYFRLRLVGAASRVDVENTVDQEFRAVRWIRPAEFSLSWLPVMKHGVYRAVFRDFYGLNLA